LSFLLPPLRSVLASLLERYRSGRAGRTRGLLLALIFEGLLILVVLTLGSAVTQDEKKFVPFTSVAFTKAQEKAPDEQDAKAPVVRPAERPAQRPVEEKQQVDTPAPETPKQPPPPALIPISPREMASSNIAKPSPQPGPPAPAKRSMMGPVDTGGAAAYADTARVGTAPNGQPMYAAAWYREPSQDELAGYLSTADGPGWGLVACKTAPDWHVDDCVALDESPPGSRIARAVVAAAWQFQVRPPRINGQYKVGEWVRIRIDYGVRRGRY
jgi:protein TonB